MGTKTFLNKILLVFALAICTFSAVFILYFIYQNSIKNDSTSLVASANFIFKKEKAIPSLPARLIIPSLNINTIVESAGLTPDGAVGVPAGPDDVAWFSPSPRPGEVGNSVIDGHSGYKNNRPAIFDSLYKLKKGDKIYVEDSQGKSIVFVVREFKSYGKNENASDVFISNDEISHLNLITCTGDWNAIEKTHSKRLVVFTDREI